MFIPKYRVYNSEKQQFCPVISYEGRVYATIEDLVAKRDCDTAQLQSSVGLSANDEELYVEDVLRMDILGHTDGWGNRDATKHYWVEQGFAFAIITFRDTSAGCQLVAKFFKEEPNAKPVYHIEEGPLTSMQYYFNNLPVTHLGNKSTNSDIYQLYFNF